ncbi:unannotated protein [freshwater metagenome]|uniref:Unannotated protein n=1 Tax=freshwater metagenome TaxID=449393 RepID=A0A6J7K503_9ZZZZ
MPPIDAGAVHETTDWPFAFEVAVTDVGAPGATPGTAAADATDATPVPAEFVAFTVNVYEVPFVRPATVHEVVEEVHVNEPGLEVTV